MLSTLRELPRPAGARPDGRRRQDRLALGVLAVLPVAVFVLPALAGHPVLPGDDLTQNFPLRVLAGQQWRHGHLPLYDPYLWSGAPLLGGWNAGAAYPLTFGFAVLPAAAAWTANMTVTWWAAGMGMFAFGRASRLSPVASFLGALSFAFAGAMSAQIPHFGLVAGMSWVPLALLATLRLTQACSLRARLLWACALAGALGLVILAGEPRAIDDAVIIVGCYAGWRAWRLGHAPGSRRAGLACLALMLAALAVGVALGAAQWLPGAEAVHTSQRVALSAAVFDSGSLPRKWLLLSLVPDLLGGSGSFGQPAFFANYNLTEVTGYVGLMPLAAACALLGKLRRGPLPEWIIWHAVAVLGVFLALGGNTALGQVLVHVPFYGDQRLQSRNLVIADLALAVLLAYWADAWLGEPKAPPGRQGWPARLLGALPGAAVIFVVAVTVAWRPGMLRWLGLSAAKATAHAGPLAPWLVPSLVLAVLAVALVWWGPRLPARHRTRALAAYVAADVTVFTLLAVLLVAPGLGGGGAGPARPAPLALPHRGPVVPVGRFTHGGRFAVYDPGLLHGGELSRLRVPDLNVMDGTPSVQGYGSIVDATYATGTGSHRATGEGQDVLRPQAIGDGTLDQLDTTALLVAAEYVRGLRAVLVPPRWRFAGFDGSFAVFTDRLARPPLSVRAVPGRPAAGASVRATAGPRFAPTRARVSSPYGITVFRAAAGIPGWTATWQPDGAKAAKHLPVRRAGLVQSVTVPAGRGTITWRYGPPGAQLGLWLSLAGLAILLGTCVAALILARRNDRNT